MSYQNWTETVTSQALVGSALNTFTTAKSILNPQALISFPPGYFQVGRILRITVQGTLGWLNVGTTTITFNHMLGSGGSVGIAFSGNINLPGSGGTGFSFSIISLMTCRIAGSVTTAAFQSIWKVDGFPFLTGVPYGTLPIANPATGPGFDSTATNVLDFFLSFNNSSATNGVQVFNYAVESLN